MNGKGPPGEKGSDDRLRGLVELCLALEEKLVAVAQTIVGDHESALDIVWEVHLRLYERVVNGEELDPEPGYLVRAVRNFALDRHRSALKRKDLAWYLAIADGVPAVPTPFEILLRTLRREILQAWGCPLEAEF